MLSETEIEESVEKVEWFIKYIRNVGVGTDSARTMKKAVEALIPCGMMPSAAIGVLDKGNLFRFKDLIRDDVALDIVGRMIWWNDTIEEATASHIANREDE